MLAANPVWAHSVIFSELEFHARRFLADEFDAIHDLAHCADRILSMAKQHPDATIAAMHKPGRRVFIEPH